jgi:hypothetical protein
MEMSGELHAPAALTWGKSSRFVLGGAQSWSERFEVEENLLPLPVIPSVYIAQQLKSVQ